MTMKCVLNSNYCYNQKYRNQGALFANNYLDSFLCNLLSEEIQKNRSG